MAPTVRRSLPLFTTVWKTAGETAYYLQIDASLVYAAGRAITQEDYETLDSPYNLYQHTGLPPTPIANPVLPLSRRPAAGRYRLLLLCARRRRHTRVQQHTQRT